MSNRTGTQKLARSIQRVAIDELGQRPSYTLCLDLAHHQRLAECVGESREMTATRMFLKHRDELAADVASRGASAIRERVVGFVRRRDVVVVQKDETMVAAVEAPRAQAEQSASLISAAPDLYRALAAVEWSDDGNCPECGVDASVGHRPGQHGCSLDAALKKARGEA